jgi:hypothetical protein
MNALAMVMGGALPISDAAIRHSRVVTSESRAPMTKKSGESDLPELAIRLLGILRAADGDIAKKALAIEAGIATTTATPHLESLRKNGLARQIKAPGFRYHLWRALPVLPAGAPVQPEVPDVLRPAAGQRQTEQEGARHDAGGDRKDAGKSRKGCRVGSSSGKGRQARNIYLNDEEYQALRELGGAAWVRQKIQEAKK